MKNHKPCLLLNSDYTPLYIISWTRAIVWSFKNMDCQNYPIEIVDFYADDYISCTSNRKYPVPAVARTKQFFQIHKQNITFSRKNIFLRDNFICQYCGQKYCYNQLTYDHVVPKSLWDKTNTSPTCWTNIVTSCITCNRKKGNRTPNQANMRLNKYPTKPDKGTKYLAVTRLLSNIKSSIPTEWKNYIPESYLLD